MKITEEIWAVLTKSIKHLDGSPLWLEEFQRMTFAQACALPALDNTVEGQKSCPTVEEKIVSLDYLSFLREQIHLNPRGEAWSNVLRKRLAVLEPFAGKTLLTATFYLKPQSTTLRIDPKTQKVIHVETN